MSIRRLVPELVSDRTKKHLMKGGGGGGGEGGPFSYCKSEPKSVKYIQSIVNLS